MLKNLVKLEFTVADKTYQFICEPDSPLEHIKEVLFQCQKYIGQVEDNIRAQKEAQATQEQQKEQTQEVKSDGDQLKSDSCTSP